MRAGSLTVVFGTGTLAFGINMPCRSTVFVGDSVFLTALMFRQMSGRAGRRGFDTLGNVVFLAISEVKINRLMTADLPSLSYVCVI
jgi:superfamily II RNA helicase